MALIPNVFESDLFTMTSMTAAIINSPYVPTRLSDLGLFEEQGESIPFVFVESTSDGKLVLLDVMPRGSQGKPLTDPKAKGIPFKIPHIPEQGQVLADEVIGVRRFGTTDQMRTVEEIRDRKLRDARRNIDYTIESHRMQCLLGNYINANNQAISLYTTFGLSRKEVAMDWANDSANQEEKHLKVQEAMEDALDGLPYTGIRVFHGKNSWAAAIANKSIRETYLNTAMAAELRADPRQPREFGGMIHERYRGTSTVKIPDNEAYAVPMGVPGLFLTRFGPADTLDAVGVLGERYHVTPELLDFNKGMKFLAQSNPLNICTRPAAIIKLKIGNS